MGHERVGVLPRTARWRAVVDQMAGAGLGASTAAGLANATLTNVRHQFLQLADENGLQAAFRFLIALPLATRTSNPQTTLASTFGIDLREDPSPLALAKAFQESIADLPHSERTDLGAKALADALSEYAADVKFRQARMFGSSPWDTWREANSAAGFCELSRLYFSNLTSRYLRYFLDREASATLGHPERLADFRDNLRGAIDSVSRHAFETSRITQSYAAGWFAKHAKSGMPPSREIRQFLSFALHKIREELRREAEHG